MHQELFFWSLGQNIVEGGTVSKGGQSPEKIVSHMFKYAVFDIPANIFYSHYIFIPDIQLRSKNLVWRPVVQ